MSNNPYVQVAWTYLRRPFSTVRSGIGVAGLASLILLSIICNDLLRHRPGNDFMSLPLVLAVLAGFLAVHVKEQFAEWRSH